MSEKKGRDFSKAISVMGKIADNKYLTAIRNGMSVIIPITIIGSCFTIALNLPIDAWKELIAPYTAMLQIPMLFTVDFMSVYVVVAIAANLCENYKMDKISTSALALLGFLIATISPASIDADVAAQAGIAVSGTVLPTGNFGAKGLFTAIVIGIATVEIVRFFKERNLVIKMPAGVPPAVINSFAALVPGIVIVGLTFVIRVVFGFDINEFLSWVFSPIGVFAGNDLLSVIVPILLICFFWIFGIHGMVIATPIFYSFWYQNLGENTAAVAAGTAVPNFMTEQFFQWFVWVGGAGATIALAALMVFAGKSQFAKQMGKFTIIPAIFNINEPLVFGTPVVMNPYFAAPFILAPLAMGIITWFAMGVLHIVSYPIAVVPWVLPGPIGALMATGFDWRAAVLCVVDVIVAILIWFPFFKAWDKSMLAREEAAAQAQAEETSSVEAA